MIRRQPARDDQPSEIFMRKPITRQVMIVKEVPVWAVAHVVEEAAQAQEFFHEGKTRGRRHDILQAGNTGAVQTSPALCIVPRECWKRVCSAEG